MLERSVVQSGADPAPAMRARHGHHHESEIGVLREQVLEPRERPSDDAPVDFRDDRPLSRPLGKVCSRCSHEAGLTTAVGSASRITATTPAASRSGSSSLMVILVMCLPPS